MSHFLKHITLSLETSYTYLEFKEENMSEWIRVCIFLFMLLASCHSVVYVRKVMARNFIFYLIEKVENE